MELSGASAKRLTVAAIGGLSVDRKVRVEGPLRPGTSNPVRGTTAAGGVARNVAESLGRLGCSVSLFSIAGRDAEAEALLDTLRRAGVDVSGVERSGSAPTARYTAVLRADGGLAFGLADMEILNELDAAWAESVAPRLGDFDLWLVDANLPAESLACLLGRVPEGVRVLADPVSVAKAERLRPVLGSVSVLFPDRGELAALSGLPAETPSGVEAASRELREAGARTVVASLGADGVHVCADGRCETIRPPAPPRVVDVTGAGDAIVAGYAFGFVTGEADPVHLGLAAASLALETDGSAANVLTVGRLRERLASVGSASFGAGS
ncbi:MAG: carbohydrate kinase family protein [Gemmatimonadota bacterium]